MSRTITVSASDTGIIIGAKGVTEIIQNVRMILCTTKGTLYLDRDFGLNPSLIDSPQGNAIVKFQEEIINQIEKYEPRVNITEVDFDTELMDVMDGYLTPTVKLEIKEGTLL